MPSYSYRAYDDSGKVVKGVMDAASRTELIDKFHKMGYMVTAVEERRGIMNLDAVLDRFRPIKAQEKLLFFIQLSNMIGAGITILSSLATLAQQIENKKLKGAIESVAKQVEAGSTLSQAFTAFPDIFPKLFVNMIRAGEASGKLDVVLMKYATFFEYQEEIKHKVRGALFYPMILLTFGLGIIIFIVSVIIPQFADIYAKSGINLPTITLVVYRTGMFIKNFWFLGLAAVILAAVAFKAYRQTPSGKLLVDSLILRSPIIGPLARKVAISSFSRTLATLTGSGVPILESLSITKDVLGNVVLEKVIADVAKHVEKGERISEPLKMSEQFPKDVVQMVAVGEDTGNLDGMLNKVADFYDTTINYTVKKLTTVIEPVFLVVMGGMVGVIMASMLLPIYGMVQ